MWHGMVKGCYKHGIANCKSKFTLFFSINNCLGLLSFGTFYRLYLHSDVCQRINRKMIDDQPLFKNLILNNS